MELLWWKCIKCTPLLLCMNLMVQYSRWGRLENILLIFPGADLIFSWLVASSCWIRSLPGDKAYRMCALTGGDLGLAPQSSRHHLNTGTAELSRQTCQMLFILSTSIIFDLCHTVKYNNAPMFSLHEDPPTHLRTRFLVEPLPWGTFFIDLSGTSEPHLF